MNEFKGTIIFKLAIFFQTFGNILTIFVELSDFGAILLDPPGRGSLWRHNITGAPVNYRDHRQNCGGVQVQANSKNSRISFLLKLKFLFLYIRNRDYFICIYLIYKIFNGDFLNIYILWGPWLVI